jgi:hypothetical protein
VVLAAGIGSLATVASAAPLAGALAISNAMPAAGVESVQWRRGWGGGGWRSGGWGWGGAGAGFVAGAILGGALAAPYSYGYGPYPGPYVAPPPVYYGPPAPPVYGPPDADAAAYCAQRFKSWDPATGTYLGYDGVRHPCP